jgi:hypothetical protein
MAPEWNLAEAKSRLSELLNNADQGMQIIRRRNVEYVVLRASEFAELTGKRPTFTDHLLDPDARYDPLEPMPRSDVQMRDLDL